jgi:hypothetical protein
MMDLTPQLFQVQIQVEIIGIFLSQNTVETAVESKL